jgi:hypothetical protein
MADIVRAHVRGELLLAEGRWQQAVEEFRRADRLEPHQTDKEYLGRALLVAALHAPDEASAAVIRKEALSNYAVVGKNPGMVWQWPLDYFPGYCADSEKRFMNRQDKITHLERSIHER